MIGVDVDSKLASLQDQYFMSELDRSFYRDMIVGIDLVTPRVAHVRELLGRVVRGHEVDPRLCERVGNEQSEQLSLVCDLLDHPAETITRGRWCPDGSLTKADLELLDQLPVREVLSALSTDEENRGRSV